MKKMILKSLVTSLCLVPSVSLLAEKLDSDKVQIISLNASSKSPHYEYKDKIKNNDDNSSSLPGVYTFKIDPTKKAQPYIGIGSSLDEATIWALDNAGEEKDSILQTLFGNGGQDFNWNFMRVTLGTADFTPYRDESFKVSAGQGMPFFYSYEDTEGNFSIDKLKLPDGTTLENLEGSKIAYLKEINQIKKDQGSSLLTMASAWSPPAWMKEANDKDLAPNGFVPHRNEGSMVGGGLIGGKLSSEHVQDFANYYLKTLQAFSAEGVNFDVISELNEPCVGTETPLVSFYPNACIQPSESSILIPAIKKAIQDNHLHTKLWIGDFNYGDVFGLINNPLIKTKEVINSVDGLAFHGYWGQVKQMHDAYADKDWNKPVNMTEFMWTSYNGSSANGIDGAARFLEYFHQGASSYIHWVSVVDPRMGRPAGNRWYLPAPVFYNAETKSYDYDFMTYAIGIISKTVTPGNLDNLAGSAHALDEVVDPKTGKIVNNYYDHQKESYIPTDVKGKDTAFNVPLVTQVTFQNPDGRLVTVMINRSNAPKAIRVLLPNNKEIDDVLSPRTMTAYTYVV